MHLVKSMDYFSKIPNMLKRLFIIIFILSVIVPNKLLAQNKSSEESDTQISLKDNYLSTNAGTNNWFSNKNRIHFGLETGILIGNNLLYTSGVSQYINPSISYNLNSKININTGIIVYNSPISGLLNNESRALYQGNNLSSFLYTEIGYFMNEKLRVKGKILYGINNNGIGSKYNQNKNLNNNLIYSIGADYKVTKNIKFGIEIRKSNLNYNYFHPYYNWNPINNPGLFPNQQNPKRY
jgi:hypothetical protein